MNPQQLAVDTADWWINRAATYGLSFIFLACVLLILLWTAISVVSVTREWVPKWFRSSIDSHVKVANAVDDLNETLACIHEQTHSIHQGAKHYIKGTSAFIRRNKSKYNVGSDVLVHFDNAEEALDKEASNVHRQRTTEEESTTEPQTP